MNTFIRPFDSCFFSMTRLIESAYRNIMKERQETISPYKMLAGVVMTQGTDQEAVVICVTSGTKCISGGNLSLEGETLNDCHAEILARRCLVQFLYDQLQTFKINSSTSIFEAGSSGRLKLKKEIFFHLYVSSSPCGDARIFTLNNKTSGNRNDRDPHPHRLGRGVLRTKIESGVGNKTLKTLFTTYEIMQASMFDRDGSGSHHNSNLGRHHARRTSTNHVLFRQSGSMECCGPSGILAVTHHRAHLPDNIDCRFPLSSRSPSAGSHRQNRAYPRITGSFPADTSLPGDHVDAIRPLTSQISSPQCLLDCRMD